MILALSCSDTNDDQIEPVVYSDSIDFYDENNMSDDFVFVVLIKPSGVLSNTQLKIAATGKPNNKSITINCCVHCGKLKIGKRISTSCIITKTTTA